MHQHGSKLADLRERLDLTQEEVANRLKLSRAALSHYETHRREPDYDTLRKFADFYDVSIDYILGRTQNPKQTLGVAIGEFVDALELSNEAIIDKFTLTIDGRKLTAEEAKRFIAFVRAERAMQ